MAESPDLNPIENLWSILDKKMKNRQCKTLDDLFKEIKRTWEQIDKKILENLVLSMPKRCQDVIDNNGYPIKY